MARVTVEDCIPRIPNHFLLTLTAATRARHGATPLVEESGKHKPTVTALREIAAGQIGVELLDRQK